MTTKKNLSKFATFLANLKNSFATLNHKHSLSDITDPTIDAEFSSTSTNPEFSGDITAYGCNKENPISLKNISDKTTPSKIIIGDIQDIISEDIQNLFL